MFDRLVWENGHVVVDDVVFEVQDFSSGARPPTDSSDRFRIYKATGLIEEYERLLGFDARPIDRMVELGLWDGGSAALWLLTIAPKLFLGIDLEARSDSPYFAKFVAGHGLEDRVVTAWGVDQSDKATLRRLVLAQDPGPLDLVIDDASHLYRPTRASFEVLFPLLRPGGWYVVEDWAWKRWKDFTGLGDNDSPERMLRELVAALGTRARGVGDVVVMRHIFAVRRTDADLPDDVSLGEMYFERPAAPLRQRLRHRAGRARGAVRRAVKR